MSASIHIEKAELVLELLLFTRVAVHLEEEIERLRGLRERLWDALDGALPDTLRHGDPEQCRPYGTS